MAATDPVAERRSQLALLVVFTAIAVLAILDLIEDGMDETSLGHLAVEGGMAIAGLAGVIIAARRLRALARQVRTLDAEAGALREQASSLEAHLAESRREAAAWRGEAKDLIAGLAEAIDRQLERWALTPAEKEIALLLLKGLSHKEVADLRSVGENTVRQQAGAIYRKSGLSGRADLAAFFLEDLLGPREPVVTPAAPPA